MADQVTLEEQMFESIESVDENMLDPAMQTNVKPKLGDVEWTDYVISHLTTKEVVEFNGQKLPKTEGLRRITNKVFGDIIYSKAYPHNVFYTDRGLVSVVSHELHVKKGDDEVVKVTGLADCREDCLKGQFSQYVTANASTKALGRALRDLLQLQVLVAEELNDKNDLIVVDNYDSEDLKPASSIQISGIKSTCKRLGIDVDKFINQGPFKYDKIDKILCGTAKQAMSVLNGYQNDKPIPESIKL